MPRLRPGLLAAWTSAWVAGQVGPDEVVDAVSAGDAPHVVIGLSPEPVALREVLVRWRQADAAVRLVLPVAGDVRGVPGPADFRAAALEAGAGVYGAGLAIVAHVTERHPSSAPPSVTWRAFAVADAMPDHQQLTEVQYELTTAIRECAASLGAADVAGFSGDVSAALAGARRAGEQLALPPGFPQRAVALLAQAERLQSVLDIAGADELGGAIDRFGIAARRSALRPLEVAVRRARLAGYNAGTEPGAV